MTATNYETRKNIKKKKKFFHKKLPERKSFYNIFLQKINIELKKILYLSQVEIDKYYLNVEADALALLIKKVIEQELNITISDLKLVDKQDFLLQSLKIHHTFIVSNHDFKFQVKVK